VPVSGLIGYSGCHKYVLFGFWLTLRQVRNVILTNALILHPQSEWAQEAPSKGAGISNIEYRLHEFRSDGSHILEQKKKERSDTTLINRLNLQLS
jgi:hypothetical protein